MSAVSALSPELRAFLEANVVGVIATRAADGRVRQSLVYYALDGDELLVSTLAGRAKARDVQSSAWASMCVVGHERPFPSLTVSGAAVLRTDGIGAATALVMQRIVGADEPPEPQSDDALAAVGRVLLAIHIDRVGPATYIT